MRWIVRPSYTPEAYDALRAAFTDGASLPPTYAEWFRYSEYFERRMRKTGRALVRIEIHLEEFRAWCQAHGRELNAAARQAFADEKMQERQQRQRS
jgi:hypothetical protein